jgi:hypothetical protein
MRKTNSFPEIRDCDESIVDYALKELQGELFSTLLIGKETGILCFHCGKRSGTDCPGRKPDESTLCKPCLLIQDAKENYEQASHFLKCLDEGMFDEEKFYHFMSQL